MFQKSQCMKEDYRATEKTFNFDIFKVLNTILLA